jgi:hypothetical protein
MKQFVLSALAGFAMCGTAFATDLSTQITQLDGKPLIGQDGKDVPFPVGDAIKNALLVTNERTLPDVKAKRFQIAVKVAIAMTSPSSDITFKPEEIVEIEKALWENQSTLVAGQAVRIIDATSFSK